MDTARKHILIVAGEISGDKHAAHLVKEIHRIDPSVRFSGLGGEHMKTAGVEIYEDMMKYAVVGFVEVLKHLRDFWRLFRLVIEKAKSGKVDAVVLVDYPGFNLRLAKELKSLDIKVIYYISPQVWAWKENRVETIRRCVDRMLVLFDFEKDFYTKRGVNSSFVGHPLVDTVTASLSRDDVLASVGFSPRATIISLLPGSRTKEIDRHLPVMLKTARRLHRDDQNTCFLIFKAPGMDKEIYEKIIARFNEKLPVRIWEDDFYNGIFASDACIAASGTATLELAVARKPMVVIYKTAMITWLLAKFLIKIPYVALVNVVAQKRVVPECLQFDANPEKIASTLQEIYQDPQKREKMKEELSAVTRRLGDKGASRRAAEEILDAVRD